MFVLSAISPEKMPSVLQNVRRVLKVCTSHPTGMIFPFLRFESAETNALFAHFLPDTCSQMVMCCFVIMLLVTLLRLGLRMFSYIHELFDCNFSLGDVKQLSIGDSLQPLTKSQLAEMLLFSC